MPWYTAWYMVSMVHGKHGTCSGRSPGEQKGAVVRGVVPWYTSPRTERARYLLVTSYYLHYSLLPTHYFLLTRSPRHAGRAVPIARLPRSTAHAPGEREGGGRREALGRR